MYQPVLTKETAEFDVDTVAVKGAITIVRPCRLLAVGAIVTSNDAGGGTLEINRRPLAGSATGESVIETITIPASDQQGKKLYEDVQNDNIELAAGDQVSFEITADPGVGATMVGFIEFLDIAESLANQADASAA